MSVCDGTDLWDVGMSDVRNIQRNSAIAHFKGPVDFMPYCERCFIANSDTSLERILRDQIILFLRMKMP